MGIGNVMKGDDGIGVYISKKIKEDGWLSLDCGTAPENFTSIIKREKPMHIVLVDAVEMNLKAGEFRIVPKERIDSFSIGTHNISLLHLISYLEEHAKNIIFIGIQPKKMDFSFEISKELRESAKRVIKILNGKEFDRLKILE